MSRRFRTGRARESASSPRRNRRPRSFASSSQKRNAFSRLQREDHRGLAQGAHDPGAERARHEAHVGPGARERLQHRRTLVEGARVLDLYAGSGAMGLEALSRGAERAVFLESDPEAVRAIEHNLDKLGLTGARVVRGDAVTGLGQEAGAGRKYDLVLADPPYTMTDYQPLSRYLSGVLADDRLLVFETAARTEPELPGLSVRTSRKYGSTRVTVFEHE